jgi:predicted Zn finger-like uncharacterized protein
MTSLFAQCPSCLTEFELDPNKVPLAGVRARCSVCSAVITVPPPAVADRKQEHTPHAASPVVETAPADPVVSTPTPSTPIAATVPIAEGQSAAQPAAPSVTPEPPQSVPPQGAVPQTPVGPIGQTRPTAPTGEPLREAPRRKPVNPFLTRDPALRAKRLARALVSDIVAYHPAKHAEGLRDGTLQTLFREEIRKSYEEYVEQVGREFAESTTHFRDALNDILAGGYKQF